MYQAGNYTGAEQVFNADLKINPNNPRSLFGLWQSLLAQKRVDEAIVIQRRFDEGWRHADVPVAMTDL